jgi:SAM-dependent methyltransferase
MAGGVTAFVKRTLLPRHTRLGRFLRRVRGGIRDRATGARPYSQEELLARTNDFNRNAERYWAELAADPASRDALLRKPFATVDDAASILYRTGLVLAELRLGVGHTVLDLGAGACWLSAFLNRLGARTIAVDVSSTALALGQELFRLDPRQRLDLDPRFLAYDGRRLPLPDVSVDRVVSFDAFHHVPNEDEILAEIFRVLQVGGRAVFAEPGEGHSHMGHSRFEAERFHVLENELDLEHLERKARAIGFTAFLAKPYPDPGAITLTSREYFGFMRGRDLSFPIDDLRRSLRGFYLFVLTKGPESFDTRNPRALKAVLSLLSRPYPVAGPPGAEIALRIEARNTGDTLWLSEERPAGGYVRLGGHLLSEQREAVNWDFLRASLPSDLPPGGAAIVEARFRLPVSAGRYFLRLDMVDEGIAWFEQHGSHVIEIQLVVEG